ERQVPKLSFTYTAGIPARFARRLSERMARAAVSARDIIEVAPSNSNVLIMSMIRSAARASSGALPCRSRLLARQRGIERGGERGLAAHQGLPRELEPFSLALRHELQPLRADGQHVGLALATHLALQRLVLFLRRMGLRQPIG